MDKINIRPAEEKDAPHIADIHVKTWQYAYRGQVPDSYLDSLSIEKRTERWKENLQNPAKSVHSFVVEVNDAIVGWCTVGDSRDEDAAKDVGELYGIYINPDYIGKGLGPKLMEHALDALRKDDYKKATLWVLDTNAKTRKWYQDKGWEVEGKIKIDKRDNFELREVRYIIDL